MGRGYPRSIFEMVERGFGLRRQIDDHGTGRCLGHRRASLFKPMVQFGKAGYVDAFMAELQGYTSISSKALQFLILTATRTSEVLRTEWPEIDLENATWTIPADRMKARREHRVPLSTQGVSLLSALPRVQGNPYVFPGARLGRPLSNMAMLQLMRGMGYGVGGERGDYVPHGFRSSFRDWSGEVSSYPRDVAEMALAHTIENKVEAAYRRGDLFEKRRAMIQEWADYLA